MCVRSLARLSLLALALPASLFAASGSDTVPSVSAVASPLVAAPGHPNVNTIVEDLVQHNRMRAAELASYTDRRVYKVSYRGYSIHLAASMVVDATYDAPATKEFRIVSYTGSKFLVDHVLKKLLTAEQEAARNPAEANIDQENYSFALLGMQDVGGHHCYVLRATPKTRSRLLFRGRLWIDAKDFAVAQVVAEPARNPSFWIRDTHIDHVYGQTGPFWLPKSDRSVTDVRLGGAAVLTIDYGVYHPVARDTKPLR